MGSTTIQGVEGFPPFPPHLLIITTVIIMQSELGFVGIHNILASCAWLAQQYLLRADIFYHYHYHYHNFHTAAVAMTDFSADVPESLLMYISDELGFDFSSVKNLILKENAAIFESIEDSTNHLDDVLEELFRYLYLLGTSLMRMDVKLAPSYFVERAWHSLMLHPEEYYLVSDKLLILAGVTNDVRPIRVLPHNPFDNDDYNSRKLRYHHTLALYENIFHKAPPLFIWNDYYGEEEDNTGGHSSIDEEDADNNIPTAVASIYPLTMSHNTNHNIPAAETAVTDDVQQQHHHHQQQHTQQHENGPNSDNSIEICVVFSDNKRRHFRIDYKTTVLKIKTVIYAQFRIMIALQILSFNGIPLADDRTVRSYSGIMNGSELELTQVAVGLL